MKIITKTNDGRPAYCIQKNEAFSLALRALFPDALQEELLEQDESVLSERDSFSGLDSANGGYEFNIVIMRKENIEWLKAQDWIVDYTKYGRMTIPEVENAIRQAKEAIKAEVAGYNSRDRFYRDLHYDEMGRRIIQEKHRVKSLQVLVKFLNGEIDFVFPDEIYAEFRRGFFGRIVDLFRCNRTA